MTTTLQAARAMAEQAKRHADNCATEFNGQILRDLAAANLKTVGALEELRDYILERRPHDEPLQVNERSMPPIPLEAIREHQTP